MLKKLFDERSNVHLWPLSAMNNTVLSALNYDRSSLITNVNDVFSGKNSLNTISNDTVSLMAEISRNSVDVSHHALLNSITGISVSDGEVTDSKPSSGIDTTPIVNNLATPGIPIMGNDVNPICSIDTTPSVNNLETPVLPTISTENYTINLLSDLQAANNTSPSLNFDTGTFVLPSFNDTVLPHCMFENPTPTLNVSSTAHALPSQICSECDIGNTLGATSSLDLSLTTLGMEESKNDDPINKNFDPLKVLRKIRVSHINRLIIGQLNINSIRNKFEALKAIVSGNLDILVITESKLDISFPRGQFCM